MTVVSTMDSCIAILHSWTMTKLWQHQSDHSTFSNCVISACCGIDNRDVTVTSLLSMVAGWVFSHTESMAKTIESEPEQFTHQNSVLLYPNTEDHKNQAFRYLKQYIILCDLCYDVTFWIPPCHWNLYVGRSSLWTYTRIYFGHEWLVYVMRMHI